MKIYDLKKDFKTISKYENIFLQKGKIEKKKFQRLEFLGDKVLGLILSSILFDMHNDYSEAMLSRTVSYLCSGKVLYKVAQDINLNGYIINKKKKITEKQLVDFLEAIIGAFYLSNGFNKTKVMILKLWENKLNNIINIRVDNKTMLQEWSQSRKFGLPKYSLLKKTGPDHSPFFTVKVEVSQNETQTGIGKTIQDAEQDAADKFLKNINNFNEKKINSDN